MLKTKEKKERALGVKLFLKAERCASPKCAMIRRPYRPGQHGKAHRRPLSEYGSQLLEKQKIKVTYGLREAQLSKIFKEAARKPGNLAETIINLLEQQFSNVVYRLGFAPSRIVARQFISHGHFLINGKKVNASSCRVKVGDIISIKPSSRDLLIFKDLPNIIKKHEPPSWLTLYNEKLEGEMKSLPSGMEVPFDINLVVDYYSK